MTCQNASFYRFKGGLSIEKTYGKLIINYPGPGKPKEKIFIRNGHIHYIIGGQFEDIDSETRKIPRHCNLQKGLERFSQIPEKEREDILNKLSEDVRFLFEEAFNC